MAMTQKAPFLPTLVQERKCVCVCADDVTAGSEGGGGCGEWTVACSSERHRPSAVLDNIADANCRNTRHAYKKYSATVTTVTCTPRLDTLFV